MSVRPCPKCHADNPRFLDGASYEAVVNFYICRKCAHVWNVLKSNPDGPTYDVTVDPPKK